MTETSGTAASNEPLSGADSGGATAAGPGQPATPADPSDPTHPTEPGKPVKPATKPARWWELPLLVVIAIAVAVLVKTFLVQPFYIPSESMENTLYGCQGCHGDKILVNKPIYHFRDPEPGDIVVFSAPSGWEEPISKPRTNAVTGVLRSFGQLVGVVPPDETDLVKRVIAVGGQTVRCCDAQGRVQVSTSGANGPWRSLTENYVFENDSKAFGPVAVPKGRLWVMGDHRQDSQDSRYHCAADGSVTPTSSPCDPVASTVPNSAVIGKAFVIAWPPHRWRTLGTPKTFQTASGLAGSTAPAGVAMIAIAPLLWRRRRRR